MIVDISGVTWVFIASGGMLLLAALVIVTGVQAREASGADLSAGQ
ncbi:hypothetical protein [Modicisalibacter luteus]